MFKLKCEFQHNFAIRIITTYFQVQQLQKMQEQMTLIYKTLDQKPQGYHHIPHCHLTLLLILSMKCAELLLLWESIQQFQHNNVWNFFLRLERSNFSVIVHEKMILSNMLWLSLQTGNYLKYLLGYHYSLNQGSCTIYVDKEFKQCQC